MRVTRALVLVTSLVLLSTACGSDDEAGPATTGAPPTTVPATTVAPTTTVPASTVPASTVAPTTTSTVPGETLVAVWPAPDVVLPTPEEAAASFVREVLGVEPVLGEFQQGDARSGEITVLSPGEGGPPSPRGVVFLRQLGADDGWFVIGAGSAVASITTPATGSPVPAGPVTVEGIGTGFEATVVVRAFVAGDPGRELDRQVVMAGNFGEPLPYTTTLDLSGAAPGEVVVLVIQGGVGLETDPGDFSAVPVVVRAG